MSILEKAIAKYHGNYEHIEAGNPTYALRTLHGSPWTSVWHEDVTWTDKEYLAPNDLWDRIKVHDKIDDMMTASTPRGWYRGEDPKNLVPNHAYVVLGTAYIPTGDIRLVKMRNPQGVDKFAGAWSDSDSANWTAANEALVMQAHPDWTKGNNDGLFFMHIDDYHLLFEETMFSFDTTDWHNAHHLALNDPGV